MTIPALRLCAFVLLVFLGRQNLAPPIIQAQERKPAEDRVSYELDVRPILRRNCYRCHGAKNQKGHLRLNMRESAGSVIEKYQADESLLIERLFDKSYGDIMPIDGKPLSEPEIKTLKRWIDQGAEWPDEFANGEHWAYQTVERPKVPQVGAETSIDQFIIRRLNQRNLSPSPPEGRARLIRRVSLALTGLPPSRQQVEEFLADNSANAYEKVVDRLLASPRYGERWAIPWLDQARYADSNGFQADQLRENWAYRDWVIRAFNMDMPFDQFVIDQIAGDLIPDSTIDQKIATGFNRMTTCNVEAGVHPEANRTNQVIDRVNTMATVFLGSTLECAQCHDHKYDPFSQKDYYQLFAYFNNTPLEVKNTSGVTWDFYGPTLELPMKPAQQNRLRELKEKLAELKLEREAVVQSTEEQFETWIASVRELEFKPERWLPAMPCEFESSGGEDSEILDDGSVLLGGSVPDTVDHVFTFEPKEQSITAIRLEVLTDDSIPGKGPGRGDAVRSNIVLSEFTCELISDDNSPVLIELQNPQADFSQKGWDIAKAIDGDRKTGWAIAPQFGKAHWATFMFHQPVQIDRAGARLRVTLGQYFGRGRVIGRPRISFSTQDSTLLGFDDSILKILKQGRLSQKQTEKLRGEYEKKNGPLIKIDEAIAKVQRQIAQTRPDTTLVMVEMKQTRETFVFDRGEYDRPTEKVTPGFPSVLPQDKAVKKTGNRLELAKLLTSRKNPLLSRVTVNRWWSELFGAGLVTTLEDFGTQSEDPSHPQLLDWLAVELVDSGWSMKHVHKLMVMSSAFQRSARVTPKLLQEDPENRLLSRGPRFRLGAELVRDNALAISGLLSKKMYGPPVMPYQPDGLWRSVGRNQPKWKSADDENRFRRGLYVVWKRAAPYPSFINFDAPDRGSCTVQRGRSNTPLQALTLLNDPAYTEMALAFADRILSESPGNSDVDRMEFAIETAIMRKGSVREIELLRQLLQQERQAISIDPRVVESRTRISSPALKIRTQDRQELAAWFAIANALLNLDETISQ